MQVQSYMLWLFVGDLKLDVLVWDDNRVSSVDT